MVDGMFARFFYDLPAMDLFLSRLPSIACPRCHHTGALRRHGFIRGYVSPSEQGIRARRVYCHPKRGGCGHAPSVRLAESLYHRCISAATLWAFLRAWMAGASTPNAWARADTGLSLRCAHRILANLRSRLASLRTALSARAPPPADQTGARNPSGQTLLHLLAVFETEDPIRAYQAGVQEPFPIR
jgi:hypothetical protein